MKNRIAARILGAFCLVACPAYALEPCEPWSYVNAVDEVIDAAMGRRPQLAITTLPSFMEEEG